jgi:hypothetical protein
MGLIGTLTTFVAGAKILASEVNANFTAIRNVVNGNIEAANLAADAVGAAAHADISASTDTYHTAASNTFSNAKFNATNASTAIVELATAISYNKTNPTIKPVAVVGYSFDATEYTALSSTGSYTAGSLKVTVPANAAATAIYVRYGLYASVNGTGGAYTLYVPIRIGTTDLSTSGSPDSKFHIPHGISAVGTIASCPSRATIINSTTYPTLDLTAANDISIGTIFAVSTGGSLQGFSNMWIEVSVI